jgi:diguanylate cyclase (GGDEF)-like protein
LPVSETRITPQLGRPDDGLAVNDLLAQLSQLIRTVTCSQRGVDAVLEELGRVAAQALGADGARVVRLTADAEHWARATAPGGTPLRAPPPLTDGSWGSAGRPTPALGLQSGNRVLGFLELPGRPVDTWSERERALAAVFAELATSCLALAEERALASDLSQALEYRSTHDELTSLPNRGLLLDRLEHALLTDARRPGVVAVMFVDIDGFKVLNDTFGHSWGDRILVSVAEGLAECVRVGDTVGRLGGDEFLVVCENVAGHPSVVRRRLRALGHRLQTRLASPWAGELNVSVSIGVAVGGRPQEAQELIRSADRAMYRAKKLGGGRVVFSGPDVVPLRGLRTSPSRPPDQ